MRGLLIGLIYAVFLIILFAAADFFYVRHFEAIPDLGDVALQMETPVIHKVSDIKGLSYDLRPGSEFGVYRINSIGMRDVEIPEEKKGYRVLIMGDSVTFGPNIPAENLYAKVAERILNDSGKKIEIYNAGVCGYNTKQEYIALKKKYISLKPDLVIFAYCVNDLSDLYVPYSSEDIAQEELRKTGIQEDGGAYRNISGVDYLSLRLPAQFTFIGRSLDRRLLLRSGFYRALSVMIFKIRKGIDTVKDMPRAIERFDFNNVLLKIKKLAAENNFSVKFLILPFSETTQWQDREIVLAALKKNNVEYWNFNSDMVKTGLDMHTSDGVHLNETGHKVTGEALAEKLTASR
jgi:lysophospholipase L1-like esterase